MFYVFDKNKDGTISLMEFSKMLVKAEGQAPPFGAIAKFFSEMDKNEDSSLEFKEFLSVCAALKAGKVEDIEAIDVAKIKEDEALPPKEVVSDEPAAEEVSMPPTPEPGSP
jgi:hypothetical protein